MTATRQGAGAGMDGNGRTLACGQPPLLGGKRNPASVTTLYAGVLAAPREPDQTLARPRLVIPKRRAARSARPSLLLNLTQMFAVFGKNLPQSQQCHPLLVGRLREPKPFEFLDARHDTGNMLLTLLNMTFGEAQLLHNLSPATLTVPSLHAPCGRQVNPAENEMQLRHQVDDEKPPPDNAG